MDSMLHMIFNEYIRLGYYVTLVKLNQYSILHILDEKELEDYKQDVSWTLEIIDKFENVDHKAFIHAHIEKLEEHT